MPVPGYSTSDAVAKTAVRATAGEGFVVASRGKNPSGGLEYLRQMLSTAGTAGFTQRPKAPTISREAAAGADLAPGMRSGRAALAAAGDNVLSYFYEAWYTELDREVQTVTNELMFGRIDPATFARRTQDKADSLAAPLVIYAVFVVAPLRPRVLPVADPLARLLAAGLGPDRQLPGAAARRKPVEGAAAPRRVAARLPDGHAIDCAAVRVLAQRTSRRR
jgi:hypothetical protein